MMCMYCWIWTGSASTFSVEPAGMFFLLATLAQVPLATGSLIILSRPLSH
jgi:hypothetical protein